jgi:hypothetical protein
VHQLDLTGKSASQIPLPSPVAGDAVELEFDVRPALGEGLGVGLGVGVVIGTRLGLGLGMGVGLGLGVMIGTRLGLGFGPRLGVGVGSVGTVTGGTMAAVCGAGGPLCPQTQFNGGGRPLQMS